VSAALFEADQVLVLLFAGVPVVRFHAQVTIRRGLESAPAVRLCRSEGRVM